MARILTQGLKTDDDIRELLKWLAEPKLNERVICGNVDHTPPFRFLSDFILGRITDFLVWANRGGSKSYLAALGTWARSGSVPGLETTILGGSLEQSKKSYKAMGDFWRLTGIQEKLLADEPTQRQTTWKNGAAVQVLTASQRSVRGPHPNCLVMDEVDEMRPDIYSAALSQPIEKGGIQSATGQLSTFHKIGGVMAEAVARAVENKTPVFRWCVWDCAASCRDYSCSTCPLSVECPGLQMKDAQGYLAIRDIQKKRQNMSNRAWQVEWLCRQLLAEDLVYGAEFRLDVHSPLDLPGFNDGLPVLVSVDWGGTNPFSVGAWQFFDGLGWVRIDEVYMAGTTSPKVLAECARRPWWRRVVGGVADPSRPDLISEWAMARIIPGDNAVDEGIESVRRALAPVEGNPLFYVNRRCRAWVREVEGYEQDKRGRPVKANDHAMDETRLFIRWQLSARRLGRVSGMRPKSAEATAAARETAELAATLAGRMPSASILSEPEKEKQDGQRKYDRTFGGRISTGTRR